MIKSLSYLPRGALGRQTTLALNRTFGNEVQERIQDPKNTDKAASFGSERGPEDTAPLEDVEGIEKGVKWEQNTPDSVGGFVKDLSNAAEGLFESVETGMSAVGNKVVDAGAAAKRAAGLDTDRQALSQDQVHTGGAGAMEYPPKAVGSKGGWAESTEVDRATAEAKYQEIKEMEGSNFPKGKESVNDMFPDMSEAARLQNESGNVKSGAVGVHEFQVERGEQPAEEEGDNGRQKKEELNKTLHDEGP